jgi:hypothetical protein
MLALRLGKVTLLTGPKVNDDFVHLERKVQKADIITSWVVEVSG